MQIKIDHQPETEHADMNACREDIANYLDWVVSQIRQGFTSGDGWEITGKDTHGMSDDE